MLVSAPAERPVARGRPALWGYCPGCEGWLLTPRWGDSALPLCPLCGDSPEVLEHVDGSKSVLQVVITVPAGASEPPF